MLLPVPSLLGSLCGGSGALCCGYAVVGGRPKSIWRQNKVGGPVLACVQGVEGEGKGKIQFSSCRFNSFPPCLRPVMQARPVPSNSTIVIYDLTEKYRTVNSLIHCRHRYMDTRSSFSADPIKEMSS